MNVWKQNIRFPEEKVWNENIVFPEMKVWNQIIVFPEMKVLKQNDTLKKVMFAPRVKSLLTDQYAYSSVNALTVQR